MMNKSRSVITDNILLLTFVRQLHHTLPATVLPIKFCPSQQLSSWARGIHWPRFQGSENFFKSVEEILGYTMWSHAEKNNVLQFKQQSRLNSIATNYLGDQQSEKLYNKLEHRFWKTFPPHSFTWAFWLQTWVLYKKETYHLTKI